MSTTTYSLSGSWNWGRYQRRVVQAASNFHGEINTDNLVINASSINNGSYWGGGIGYNYAFGLSSSDITFTGSNVSISSYAEALNAWSHAIFSSTLSITGDDNKQLNIDAV